MEPPVAASGPILRRASTFSHRTERALKDVNGRAGLVNKSHDRPFTSKPAVDAQKVTRPSKHYSAVASRYAAPLVSKKAVGDASHGGHSNMTKLSLVAFGRSAPIHQRRPSSDMVSSCQAPMVFAASCPDAKADTLTKRGDASGSLFGGKRSRVGVRASMVEKKSAGQTRAPRILSLDKGGCTCSKSGPVRGCMEAGRSSLLYCAGHWVSLVKLAEGEKKHSVVVDLFRLAIRLKAEPRKDVVAQLKRYQESWPTDKVVNELVEQCEGSVEEVFSRTNEVVDTVVCDAGDVKSASCRGGDGVGDDAACMPESEVSDGQETSGFKIGAQILDLASKIGRKVEEAPSSGIVGSPAVTLVGSTLRNSSAGKRVDSLSGWLDGDVAGMVTIEVQSAPEVDFVDLNPCRLLEPSARGSASKGRHEAEAVRKMTRSSSMKKPAAKEEQPEGSAEPNTPALRRSARIQKKVQSRTNMLFKEEY